MISGSRVDNTPSLIHGIERIGGAGFTLAPAAVTRVNGDRYRTCRQVHPPSCKPPSVQLMAIALDFFHAEGNSTVGEI